MANLLTPTNASPKLAADTVANEATESAILYLASAEYDRRLCPAAGACAKAELGLCMIMNAGRAAMKKRGETESAVITARKRKSDWLFRNRLDFEARLIRELRNLVKRARKKNKRPAARLNGGSDLDWSHIYAMFPEIQFWEYTKRPDLALKLYALPNVHVTYSFSEATTRKLFTVIFARGIDIAVVFGQRKGQPLPELFWDIPVYDADKSDYRWKDKQRGIAGLRFKCAPKDWKRKVQLGIESGFVQPVTLEAA